MLRQIEADQYARYAFLPRLDRADGSVNVASKKLDGRRILTFLGTTESAFTPTQFVAHAHQQLTQATFLPWWKDQNASHIVVVPAHLFLAEEAHDLSFGVLRICKHEKVVSKCRDIVEDGLCVEEEFGEQGGILGIQLLNTLASHQATLKCDRSCVPCALHHQSHISIGRPFGILVFPAAVRPSADRLSELCQLIHAVLCFSKR